VLLGIFRTSALLSRVDDLPIYVPTDFVVSECVASKTRKQNYFWKDRENKTAVLF